MTKFFAFMTVSAFVGLSACGTDPSAMGDPGLMGQGTDVDTTKKILGTIADQTASGTLNPNLTASTAKIQYHGGPVMTSAIKLYYIWYGAWSASDKAILTDFANSIGGSPYWNINTAYTQSDGMKVSSSVSLAGQVSISSLMLGSSLSDAQIQSLVTAALDGSSLLDAGSTKLPLDANGIYLVLTAPGVTATSGFCTTYCGWHSNYRKLGVTVKYGFVGNPTKCMSSCAAQTTGPNGSASVDGMISNLAAQLNITATDPEFNAWYDLSGNETSTKCAWQFGTTSIAANGAKYNVTLGPRNYLIQQNWRLSTTQACALR